VLRFLVTGKVIGAEDGQKVTKESTYTVLKIAKIKVSLQ